MRCSNCGNDYPTSSSYCPKCGENNPNYEAYKEEVTTTYVTKKPDETHQNNPNYTYTTQYNTRYANKDDSGGFGLWCLGFMIPLVGLILYLVWKDDKPLSAKSAGQGALFSFVIVIGLYVLAFILALIGV